MEYRDFLENKKTVNIDAGFNSSSMFRSDKTFNFQHDVISWATRRGRSAPFLDTGLGKTLVQQTWANHVLERTNKPVLVCTPLCVAQQTVREGRKFGIESIYCRDQPESTGIHVCNYEMIGKFNPRDYSGLVIDESSILKSLDGKLRKQITEFASSIPYRLSCTATPSPNDYMEIGTQSEFLSIMTQLEMLAMYFIHDSANTSKWRLKGHAAKRFWEWMSTWAIVLRNPSDLGYANAGYDLPELIYHEHVIETPSVNSLFHEPLSGLSDRLKARRETIDARVDKCRDIAKNIDSQVAIWCNLNEESEKLSRECDAVEIKGSDSIDHKEQSILGFTDNKIGRIVTKPKIAGFGVNWQNCNNTIVTGLNDSFESFYQLVRRFYRYGQTKPVNVHIVTSDREGAILANIKEKEKKHKQMQAEMAELMKEFTLAEIKGSVFHKTDYNPNKKMEWVF